MSTNILINSRSMNGIITISDGTATLENGDLVCDDVSCDDVNSSNIITNNITTNVLTCQGSFRSNIIGPYTIPTLTSSEYGSLISYGNTSGNGATDFTNFQSTYTSTKGGFNFWNKSTTQTLTNLGIIDNTQTYFKSQLIGCTAETPLNPTSIVNKTYTDSNFIDFTTDQTILASNKRFNGLFCTGLSITPTLGGTGNRQQIYISGTSLEIVGLFNNNIYSFYTRDGASTQTNPVRINSASTTITNNLTTNNLTADVVTGTQNIYTTNTTGTINIGTGQTTGNLNLGTTSSFTNINSSLLLRTKKKINEMNNITSDTTVVLSFPLSETNIIRTITPTLSSLTITLPAVTANERGMLFNFFKFRNNLNVTLTSTSPIFTLNDTANIVYTNTNLLSSDKRMTTLMCGFSGTLNYWIEVSNYSTFDRDYNNTIYPRLSIENTFTNTNIFNSQTTFNNTTPFSNATPPTAVNHLVRKDYCDNNFMFKSGTVAENIGGIKTFTNKVNFNGSPCMVATGSSEFSGANGYFQINPNMGSGTLNAASEPGTIGIVGLKDQTNDKVLFTLYGTTHVSVKLSFSGVSMGFGGQSNQGNTSVTCDGTNVIIKPNIKFSGDNTIQNSAFTGAGSLSGTYNLSNITIDTNGKITSLNSGLSSANIFTNTNTFNDIINSKTGLRLVDVTPSAKYVELSVLNNAMSFSPSFNNNSFEFVTKNSTGSSTIIPVTINFNSTTFNNALICNYGATFNTTLPTSTVTPINPSDLTTKAYVDGMPVHVILNSNNIWTGTNTFNTTLPTSTISASSPNQFTIKSFTDATYATITSLGSYLTISNAAATYATIASLGSYLTTSTAAATYATIASLGSYLTTSTAAATYQPMIVGSIIQMAAGVVPSGYLECNGASVDNNTYGALFNVIGYTYGGTYPSAIYSLPDFRGVFLRGKGVNGIDNTYASSTNYGFLQRDGLKAHSHGIDFGYSDSIQGGGSGATRAYVSTSPNYNNPGPGTLRASGFTVNNPNPDPDTHPANYAVLFCIKY